MNELEETYVENHFNSGFKVGDKVKIVRAAKNWEDGWKNTWESPEMDEWVGKTGYIVGDHGKSGRGFDILEDADSIEMSWSFPYFVLEKVED